MGAQLPAQSLYAEFLAMNPEQTPFLERTGTEIDWAAALADTLKKQAAFI